MPDLRVRTDLLHGTVVAVETVKGRRADRDYAFTVYARVDKPPSGARLVIELPEGLFLPDDDRGERLPHEGLEIGWPVDVVSNAVPSRTTITVRLMNHRPLVASAEIPIGIAIEGFGTFDPERDGFPFAATPHCFGAPRPARPVFDRTFAAGVRTPVRGRLCRGLYRRLFAHGLSSGMARAALTLAGRAPGTAPGMPRLLDARTRELVQILHGRQLGDGAVRAWRHWIARADPAEVFAVVREDLRRALPQRYAIDVGLPSVSRWEVFAALTAPRATVVPYQYRINPDRTAHIRVYDPAHPHDDGNSVLTVDLEARRCEYRRWSSDGPGGPSVPAAVELAQFAAPSGALQAGLAQVIGLA